MDPDFIGKPIGIVGLGLIGGSLARAFTRSGCTVFGVEKDPAVCRAALDGGAAARASQEPSALGECGAVFVALAPSAAVSFVRGNAGLFRGDTVVIDCCGIKSPVCRELEPFSAEKGFLFLGGHPMAGTEKNGFAASRADLFEGASFLLTPRPDFPAPVLRAVEALLARAGFAKTVLTTPEEHDRLIAFTSQLPHALACSYVKSPSCPRHKGFSAGSYKDVSRVAGINAPLWAELMALNRAPLCEELDLLLKNLSALRDAVASGDGQALETLLAEGRDIKNAVG